MAKISRRREKLYAAEACLDETIRALGAMERGTAAEVAIRSLCAGVQHLIEAMEAPIPRSMVRNLHDKDDG